MKALVTLHGSDSYRFITVADNGIVSSYNPRTVSGDVQTSVYVRLASCHVCNRHL